MPIHKTPKKRQPLWKEWDKLAQKEGIRAPVYAVNGDVYTGDWSDNKKHGKIIMPAWDQGCKLVCGDSSYILLYIQEREHRCGRRLVQFMMETGRRGCAMALGCTA